MATIFKEPVAGNIVVDSSKVAIRLLNNASEQRVFLAYSLVTQGPGLQILPTTLLDDWGNEIRPPKLYHWIKENGLHFPRAEVFGQTPTGAPVQYFLRDLELFGKYPLYAYNHQDESDALGLLVNAILIPEEGTGAPYQIEPPEGIGALLRQAQITWWKIHPDETGLSFIDAN